MRHRVKLNLIHLVDVCTTIWKIMTSVVTHFWVPTRKMRKYKKKLIYQKIFGRNLKNSRKEKRMLEC
jgi:hypothetical protein